MDTSRGSGHTELQWVDVDACTLPTAERPLRPAEFDALFATSLRSVETSSGRTARMTFGVDGKEEGLADQVRGLATAENACCSFFTFTVTEPTTDTVALDVEVPTAYADVLSALVERAAAAAGVQS